MRQTLPFLLLAAAAGAVFYYSRKAKFAGAVRFGLKEIKIVQTNIIAKLSILNPTNQHARISSIVGTLYYNDKAIATIKNFYEIQVKPTSETDFSVTFVPSLAGIITSIADLAGSKKVKGFKVVGSALVNNVLVPLNFSA